MGGAHQARVHVAVLPWLAHRDHRRSGHPHPLLRTRRHDASRTLGAPPQRTFWRIAIPTALPGLAAGTALALGRALGEFGATLMFAGSFRGITQTVPLAIYERFSVSYTHLTLPTNSRV